MENTEKKPAEKESKEATKPVGNALQEERADVR